MRILFALLPLLVMCSLEAQDQPRDVEIRTLCFDYSSGLKTFSLAGDIEGKSQAEIKLTKYLGNESEKLTIVEGKLLAGEPSAEGFEAWATVTVPPSLSEVLLVFFPTSDEEKPYRIKVLDDSAKAFPLGSFFIANMSPSSLRFIVGETPYQVKSGETDLLSEFKNRKANGQVAYYAYYQKDGDWRRLSSGFWSVVERKRTFQIAYQNPKNGRVELRGYSDGYPAYKALIQSQDAN